MTTSRATGLAIAVAIALAVPATAHAQLMANAPPISTDPGQVVHGMVIVMNQTGAAVTVTDFTKVAGMCADPDPFGTPRGPSLPTTISAGGTMTFDLGVGPFHATGVETCRYSVINDSGATPQVTVTVNVGPMSDPNGGVTILPNGLAFGAVAPGATVDRTIDSIMQDPAGNTNTPNFTLSGAPVFEMRSPCTTTLPGQNCSGGVLGPAVVITDALVRCAPPAGTPAGWYQGQLLVQGWMTMLDSIQLTCDVRGTGGGPTPDAAPGTPDADPDRPDADPFAPDADPLAPDARPGGPGGGADGVTDYYACGCDGGTGASGALLVLIVFVSARRGR